MELGKVLIVEDEPLIAIAASENLIQQGYDVVTALDADEPFACLKAIAASELSSRTLRCLDRWMV